MKKFSLISFVFMVGLLLFLGGCQKEDEYLSKRGFEKQTPLILDSTMLNKFLFINNGNISKSARYGEDLPSADSLDRICSLILKQDSAHHFLATFLTQNGYPDWMNSFFIQEERGLNQIIIIPFVKDSFVTGVLQYHTLLAENGLTYFSKAGVNQLVTSDLQDKPLEISGILSYIIAQNRCFGKVDSNLLGWMTNYSDRNLQNQSHESNRWENCITFCGWTAHVDHISNLHDVVFYVWECNEICYETNPLVHSGWAYNYLNGSSANWWNLVSNNFNDNISGQGTSGPSKSTEQINQEEAAKKKKALEECVMSQNDSETEAMLNEALEDITLPCLNSKQEMLEKQILKNKIKLQWCEDQYDNPGALMPDGTHEKPKMTEADIEKELDEALEGVDYITNALGNCPNAACMLNKLKNVTGSNICDVAHIFDSSTDSNFGVKLEIGNLPPASNGLIPYAQTIYSGGESKITLDINRVCNEPSPLIVAETIMHEMMHALFYESMEKIGWTGSDATRTQFFNQLINNWMSASPGKTENEIMTEYYLEPMANTLWSLNNQLGQPTDYYGLLLYGLNSTDGGLNNVIANQFNLTSQDILSAYATSINIVVKPSTLNFTNCN